MAYIVTVDTRIPRINIERILPWWTSTQRRSLILNDRLLTAEETEAEARRRFGDHSVDKYCSQHRPPRNRWCDLLRKLRRRTCFHIVIIDALNGVMSRARAALRFYMPHLLEIKRACGAHALLALFSPGMY